MNPFAEDPLVEETVVKLISELWQDAECHINAYTDAEDAKLGREHRGEVVLKKYLLPALERLNSGLPHEALMQAVEELVRDRSHLGSIVNANHEVYKLLKDGASVTVRREDGSSNVERVRFLDYDNPSNNHFLCVSQLWVSGQMYTRRPDVVLFVNGIPLIILELKASHKNLVNAYKDNIRDYKDTIPKIFWYTMGIIISNGIESKFGSVTAPFEYFNEWKKIANEEDPTSTDLRTILFGVCDKSRMLDLFENFVLFDESKGGKSQIVPRYFQYYGVNKAFENVKKRKEIEGKLGVFWHTQGSGKSYSMVFLSQKVFRKLSNNFTFVIVTDRGDLDRQSYKGFSTVGAVYEKEVQAASIVHLHELLAQDHRQIFTTIHKFQHIDGPISERDDIIVMTDEAHRTQYDKMAQNMRKALPNASFIGFTGTPLMDHGEEKTRETFGNYVSVYNFGQSVEDKATVPLFYENRVPKLENVNEHLEKDLEKVLDFYELNPEDEERIEQEFSTFYHLITREDRLNTIARDIVSHFVGRGYNGKAMVVSVDKKTAIRMYTKVKAEWDRYIAKLRMDLVRAKDEHEQERIQSKFEMHQNVDMAVVVSQGQNEIADMDEYEIDMRPIRERMQREDLEEEFKKDTSNLRIVFVCAMWLTGFDVPTLSTLYLDKPLQNHTLMQTIARANRVAEDKKNGLIVDYIGVFKNVQKALAIYASTNSKDAPIHSKDELLTNLIHKKQFVLEFLGKLAIDVDVLIKAPVEMKLLLMEKFCNTLLSTQETKKTFLNLASDLHHAYQSVLPEPEAENYYLYATAVKVLASRLRDVGMKSFDDSPVKKDLEALLNRSIQAGEYVIPQNKKIKDLSKLDANALHDFFEKLQNKNIQIEALKEELEDKIKEMMKKNKQRAQFMERLMSLLHEYNSGAADIDTLFDNLVYLARELTNEEQRAVKENLSEEELAIFDLLMKDNLNPDEVEKVKKVAKDLLEKLKREKLVLDWREKESTRAGVKTVIFDHLYGFLPEPVYTDKDCEFKGMEIYNFMYEHYLDARTFVGA